MKRAIINRKVFIEIDGDELIANVTTDRGEWIGSLNFKEIEEDRGSYLKLVWAYLDALDSSYTRQGIGRECVRLMKESSGLSIFSSDNDSLRQDDGSHLTGDAPGFIAKLNEEGLILSFNQDREEDD